MPRKRAIGRLRSKSSRIINRNCCFEAVFDSVWKSDFPARASWILNMQRVLQVTASYIHFIWRVLIQCMEMSPYIHTIAWRCAHTCLHCMEGVRDALYETYAIHCLEGVAPCGQKDNLMLQSICTQVVHVRNSIFTHVQLLK